MIKRGSRRFVVLTKSLAIKIPRLDNWVAFIRGVNENLEERYWYCTESGSINRPWNVNFLAPIVWADRFGFIVVMKKVDTESRPESYEKDFAELKNKVKNFTFHRDMKPENTGYYDGSLVVCDYGYFGGTKDCYIGCKAR